MLKQENLHARLNTIRGSQKDFRLQKITFMLITLLPKASTELNDGDVGKGCISNLFLTWLNWFSFTLPGACLWDCRQRHLIRVSLESAWGNSLWLCHVYGKQIYYQHSTVSNGSLCFTQISRMSSVKTTVLCSLWWSVMPWTSEESPPPRELPQMIQWVEQTKEFALYSSSRETNLGTKMEQI